MVKILVVDDDAIIQRLVKHTLKSQGIETISAINGTQALDIAGQQTFDLCLVDINLPDIDGFTVLKRLKAMPGMESVPMVTFTARNNPDDPGLATSLGAEAFLYKPFSTGELREMVARLLG